MKVAICQPHFLGYTGHFAMMDSVDKWVFYDDVQYEHQSWQSRNRIKLADGRIHWLSVPVEKRFGQKINEVKISYEPWEKMWGTIEQSYSKTSFFGQYVDVVRDMIISDWIYLADKTMYIERMIAELLGIKLPEFLKSSNLHAKGTKTDRVINILKEVGATEYVSGQAAKAYIERDKFKDIKLTWFDWKHPVYPQRGAFVGYLSAIDLLFNTGEEAIKYIRGNNVGSGDNPCSEGE